MSDMQHRRVIGKQPAALEEEEVCEMRTAKSSRARAELTAKVRARSYSV
jgi:hypothetical protein